MGNVLQGEGDGEMSGERLATILNTTITKTKIN